MFLICIVSIYNDAWIIITDKKYACAKKVAHKCTQDIYQFICMYLFKFANQKKIVYSKKKSNNSNTYPTPLNRIGLLVGLPTIVGAFSKFAGSATIRVCWRQKLPLINKDLIFEIGKTHGNSVYLSRIRNIIVVMVNDSSLFLIKFDATFAAQLPQRVTCNR